MLEYRCVRLEGDSFSSASIYLLDGFTVHTRYPGQSAAKEEAQAAFKIAKNIFS